MWKEKRPRTLGNFSRVQKARKQFQWLSELYGWFYTETCFDASAGTVTGLLFLNCLTAASRYGCAGASNVLWLQQELCAWLSDSVWPLQSSISWVTEKEKQLAWCHRAEQFHVVWHGLNAWKFFVVYHYDCQLVGYSCFVLCYFSLFAHIFFFFFFFISVRISHSVSIVAHFSMTDIQA